MSPTVSSSRGRTTERRSRAFLRLLASMCRQFPDLKEWLVEDFARDAQTRTNFIGLVEKGGLNADETADGFAEIADELGAWTEERRQMQVQLPSQAARLFGGLTWEQIEALVRHYEARTIRLDVFLLARDWRKAGEAAKVTPQLLRAGADFLDSAIRPGDARSIAQLGNAVGLLASLEKGRLRTAFGYADWWKLHALVYMMRHRREAYRTRDVRAHLASLGLQISSLDFRRFCKRHGIRRDERAGRPRKLVGNLFRALPRTGRT